MPSIFVSEEAGVIMGNSATEAGLIKDFCIGLSSSSAALITFLIGIYTFSARTSSLSIQLVLFSSISYLIALVSGIVAFMALISSIHNEISPYSNLQVRIPAFIQLCAFVLGATITVYAVYTLVN